MPTAEDKLIESWTRYPTITPVIGEPTYKDLDRINLQLNTDAASVYSSLGSGQQGLLKLTVTEEIYGLHLETPFVAPINPGTKPTYPDNPT